MRIAVLVPCYNEAITIAKVINDFKYELSDAEIYVYDNNSTDDTESISIKNGATVRREYRQGKGHVIRSMFRDIDADIYIMIDGDDTYPADCIHKLLEPVLDGRADICIGNRHADGRYKEENGRALHNFGNHLVKYLINSMFRSNLQDIMSGYRIMNRAFVHNIPIMSNGFEVETEMTLHALDKKFKIVELPIKYRNRPEGSFSKLNTITDGLLVIKTIFWLFKDYKPLKFFGFLCFLSFSIACIVGFPVITEFMQTQYITRVPSAILASGLMIISVLSLFVGFVLDTVVKHHQKQYALQLNHYYANK